MAQQNNQSPSLPLWKRLNGERTQGEWMAKTYGNGFNNRIETNDTNCRTIADCYHEGKEPNWRWLRENITHNQSEANAAFTALAVNNLASLAKALEQIKNLATISNVTVGSVQANNIYKIAKEALNKIS